jgi:hypothetical protein
MLVFKMFFETPPISVYGLLAVPQLVLAEVMRHSLTAPVVSHSISILA